MRNNRQDLIINIKIIKSLLNYSNEDLIKLYNKDIEHITKMSYSEMKIIYKDLYSKYKREEI